MLHPATSLKAAAITLISYFAPLHEVLIASLFLVLLDATLGIWAAKVKKQKITSHKFSRTISKLVVYFAVICLAFIIQKVFTPDYPIQSMVTSFIGLGESLSILENINTISKTNLLDKLIDILKQKNDDDSAHK